MATATRSKEKETSSPSSPPAPEPPAARVRFTAADSYRMAEAGILHEDSRVELIEGDLIAMCPIGPRHAGEVTRLISLLSSRVAGRALVSAQNPIKLDEHTEPQPDVMLLRPRDDFYSTAHPKPEDILLLIEVMDTSALYDRGTKLRLYARFAVAEVWLIDLDEQQVEVHRGLENGTYTERLIRGRGHAVAPAALPDLELGVDAIFG